jgi:hypothetical protein
MVTAATFKGEGLATKLSRTNCLYTDIEGADGRLSQSSYLPQRWSRDPKTKAYIAPPIDPRSQARNLRCVAWPPLQLLLAKYARADDTIVLPAIRRVKELQRRRLSRSLDCAYVRPDPVGEKPAYAAFRDPALRDLCRDVRRKLLKHPARMLVEYETAREVDPKFAAALKEAGVPTTLPQRAAAKFRLRAAEVNRPLDPETPEPDPPLDVLGGLPFDPDPEPEGAQRRWVGPALLGGAALATAVAVAVGVRRSRRARTR